MYQTIAIVEKQRANPVGNIKKKKTRKKSKAKSTKEFTFCRDTNNGRFVEDSHQFGSILSDQFCFDGEMRVELEIHVVDNFADFYSVETIKSPLHFSTASKNREMASLVALAGVVTNLKKYVLNVSTASNSVSVF